MHPTALHPGSNSSNPGQLTAAGPTLFLVANDATHGPELWKSDGTAAGTTLVRDLRPGPLGADVQHLTTVGNQVFFQADDGTGRALWTSDGTAQGTTLLMQGSVSNLTAIGGLLFFGSGGGLWTTDGTPAGTTPVLDQAGDQVTGASDLVDVNGVAFFQRAGGLWKATRGAPPPPPPPSGDPSNQFSFGKVNLNRKRGIARMVVRVPGPGRVVLQRTKQLHRAVERVEAAARATRQAPAASRVVLRVRPRGKAQRRVSNRRCKRSSKKRLRVRVRARVAYRPAGGTPRTKQRRVRLVKRC